MDETTVWWEHVPGHPYDQDFSGIVAANWTIGEANLAEEAALGLWN